MLGEDNIIPFSEVQARAAGQVGTSPNLRMSREPIMHIPLQNNYNQNPIVQPVENPELAAQYEAQQASKQLPINQAEVDNRQPEDTLAPEWKKIAGGRGNRFQSAPESYFNNGEFNKGLYLADLIRSGVTPSGDIVEYGMDMLKQGAKQKSLGTNIGQSSKAKNPFSEFDDETLDLILASVPDDYPLELLRAAVEERESRDAAKQQANQTAQTEQQDVQQVGQQQSPTAEVNLSDTSNIEPGAAGHEDVLGSTGHNLWVDPYGNGGNQQQADESQQFAASASNISPDELQYEGGRLQYERQRREHPWLNFFLGPNKDEQFAEDHGWKYHNNIEHGWVIPSQQGFRTAMANAEKWMTPPDQQRYVDERNAQIAQMNAQNNQQVVRASYANSMFSNLLRNVRSGAYAKDSQALQREMAGIQQMVDNLPQNALGMQTRHLWSNFANLINSDYWSSINFDPKALGKLGRMVGTAMELKDMLKHYNPSTKQWDNEKIAKDWYSLVDASVDSLEQILTGSGSTMADAARIRAWHKWASADTYREAKKAIENYTRFISQVIARITDPSAKMLLETNNQKLIANMDRLNLGKSKDDNKLAKRNETLLDTLGDLMFGLKSSDFQTKEDYAAALVGAKNAYDAYQKALLYSGGLDNGAILEGLNSASNMAKNAYNIKARQINAKPFTGNVTVEYGDVPDNPQNYVDNIDITDGIGGFNKRKTWYQN